MGTFRGQGQNFDRLVSMHDLEKGYNLIIKADYDENVSQYLEVTQFPMWGQNQERLIISFGVSLSLSTPSFVDLATTFNEEEAKVTVIDL